MGGLISILIKSLTSFGIKLFMTLASEKMIEWMFFKIARAIVKSTKTTQDDEWFNKLYTEYKNGQPVDHVNK